MPRRNALFGVLAAFFLPLLSLQSQTVSQGTGAVTGVVRASDGTPLKGAAFSVEGTDHQVATDLDGSFVVSRIPAGKYTVTAKAIGYAPATREIQITAGRATRLEIALSKSTVELSAITVVGARRYGANASKAAMKMDVPVLDVPQSMVVISEDFMKDQKATGLDDLLRNVAGLSSFSDYQDFTARGFRSGEDEVTYNGTRSNPVNFFGSPNLSNVERVEVLKGPSGVLYGSIEGGAMINLVTKSPKARPQKSIDLSGGSYNNYEANGDITGPVAHNDKILYRFNGHYQDTKSFRRFLQSNNWSVAPSVTFLPASKTNITLKGEYMVDDKKGARNRGTAAVLGDLYALPWDWTSNEPGDYANSKAYTGEFNVSQGLIRDWTANGIVRYSHSDYENAYHESQGFSCSINNATSAALLASCQSRGGRLLMRRQYRHQDFKWNNTAYTGTVNGTVKTGPISHRLLFGGDYTVKHRLTDPSDYANGVPSGVVTSLDLFNPVYNADPSKYEGQAPADAPFTRDYADGGLYASNMITFIPQIKAVVGFRYNDYMVHNYNYATKVVDDQKRTSNTRRAGLVIEPLKWISLYASYSEGFKPQTNSQEDKGGPFDPLITKQNEEGFKLGFFGERLIWSGATYRINKDNVLVPDPDPTKPNFLTTIGQVRSKGYETDVVGSITPSWSVTANYASNDTKVSKDPRPAQVGSRFPNAPRDQAALWTRYELPHTHLALAAGATHVGRRLTFDTTVLPKYTIYDAAAYYDLFGRYKLQVNVKNLTNERYFAGGYMAYQLFSGSPRTVQTSIRATF
jgi:iron complex outermembrane receptor protein